MGRAWTKETSTKLGVASSTMQFAGGGATADTEESYTYGRPGSKKALSESDGAV